MNADILQSRDPRLVGQRLQDARKARGLTQGDVADHMGMARTTVTAIEKGERRLQAEELVRLAALYGRSVGDILRQSEPTKGFGVQLRSTFTSHELDERELAPYVDEFQRLCEDYLELERICSAPLVRRYPVQYPVSGVTPEVAAEDVAWAERNRLGLGDGPLLNLREVLEGDVGLRIFFPNLPSKVAAMFEYTEDLGGCIAVNRNHPQDRGRMSLCHDYAHFLTNRYQPEVALTGTVRRQSENERFAETFAHAFLMPSSGLTRRFHELHRSRSGQITPADLCILAHLYFVSLQALVLRLEDLKLLRSGTWERLQRSGFKVRQAQKLLGLEPHSSVSQMLPLRYRLLAVSAYTRGELSEGQLAQFLRTDRLEARQVVEDLSQSMLLSEDGMVEGLQLELDTPLAGRSAWA